MENFLIQSSELINRLNQLQIELSIFEQAENKELCQEAIQIHTNLKQKIFSISIEPLVCEGRNLLKILCGNTNNDLNEQHNHHQQQHSLNIAGARDSGYSGSSNESNEKFNYDYFNEANKIKEPMEQLRISKQKLQSLWQQKKVKLEQCLQLRIFEQDCNQMLDWLNYNNNCILNSYTDIGYSYTSAIELLNKHEQFHKNCFNGVANIQHINVIANKLISNQHYASTQIQIKLNQLDKEWQLFHSIIKNRQKILSASCMFHQKADQVIF